MCWLTVALNYVLFCSFFVCSVLAKRCVIVLCWFLFSNMVLNNDWFIISNIIQNVEINIRYEMKTAHIILLFIWRLIIKSLNLFTMLERANVLCILLELYYFTYIFKWYFRQFAGSTVDIFFAWSVWKERKVIQTHQSSAKLRTVRKQ